ncbi:hypothetical protein ACVDG5_034460 [Mesorhizobium sp. ORM6]
MLVFAGIYRNRELFLSERVAVLAAALLVSALSWRFVERPFRRRATGWKWMLPAAGTMAAMCFYLDAIHLSRASRHVLAPIFAKLISSSVMNLH